MEKYFAALAARKLPQRYSLNEVLPRGLQSGVIRAITASLMFILVYRVPVLYDLNDKMPYALAVLSEILGGNSSSRLAKNLVRGRQTAADIGASYELFARASTLYMIRAMPFAGTGVNGLVDDIRREIADVVANGVSEEELARVHTQMAASETFSKDSMDSQARMIGTLESHGFGYRDETVLRQQLA